MAIVIEDEETGRLARQLARQTGETIAEAVSIAIAERLARVPAGKRPIDRRKLAKILAEVDALPHINEHLTADEIIGYDEFGLPR